MGSLWDKNALNTDVFLYLLVLGHVYLLDVEFTG